MQRKFCRRTFRAAGCMRHRRQDTRQRQRQRLALSFKDNAQETLGRDGARRAFSNCNRRLHGKLARNQRVKRVAIAPAPAPERSECHLRAANNWGYFLLAEAAQNMLCRFMSLIFVSVQHFCSTVA